jgi:hypothetical protein
MRKLQDAVCRQCGTPFRYAPKQAGYEAKFCGRACDALWRQGRSSNHSSPVRTAIGEFPSKSAALKAFVATMEPI